MRSPRKSCSNGPSHQGPEDKGAGRPLRTTSAVSQPGEAGLRTGSKNPGSPASGVGTALQRTPGQSCLEALRKATSDRLVRASLPPSPLPPRGQINSDRETVRDGQVSTGIG